MEKILKTCKLPEHWYTGLFEVNKWFISNHKNCQSNVAIYKIKNGFLEGKSLSEVVRDMIFQKQKLFTRLIQEYLTLENL